MLTERSISQSPESFHEGNNIDESVLDVEWNKCESEMIFLSESDNGKKSSESNDDEFSNEQNSNVRQSWSCSSHQRQSTIFSVGSQLVTYVGRKDVLVAMLFSASVVISTIIVHAPRCLYYCECRSIPENVLFMATSAIDVKVYAWNFTFCNASSSIPNPNTTNLTMNTMYVTVEGYYDKIARCFGWSVVPAEVEAEKDLWLTSLCVLIYLLLSVYCLTDLEGCRSLPILLIVAVTMGLVLYITILSEQVIVLTLAPIIITVFLPSRYISVEWQLSLKWLPCFFALLAVNIAFFWIAFWSPLLFNQIIVYVPLILTANEFIFSKVMERCFTAHRGNQFGMSFLMTGYLFTSEGIRFGSFLALWVGYKHKVKKLSDLLFNIVFSIFGEVFSHSGIREVTEKWLGQWILFVSKMNSFPEVRGGISSIRQVCEVVMPASALSNVIFFNVVRNCLPIYSISFLNQINFFTSKRLMKDIWEALLCYYSVEVLALVLCNRITKWTSFLELSGLGSLKPTQICLLAVKILFISPPVLPIFFIPAVMDYDY